MRISRIADAAAGMRSMSLMRITRSLPGRLLTPPARQGSQGFPPLPMVPTLSLGGAWLGGEVDGAGQEAELGGEQGVADQLDALADAERADGACGPSDGPSARSR